MTGSSAWAATVCSTADAETDVHQLEDIVVGVKYCCGAFGSMICDNSIAGSLAGNIANECDSRVSCPITSCTAWDKGVEKAARATAPTRQPERDLRHRGRSRESEVGPEEMTCLPGFVGTTSRPWSAQEGEAPTPSGCGQNTGSLCPGNGSRRSRARAHTQSCFCPGGGLPAACAPRAIAIERDLLHAVRDRQLDRDADVRDLLCQVDLTNYDPDDNQAPVRLFNADACGGVTGLCPGRRSSELRRS
jgi:hypothetical protein